jgi:hypothetical protein
VAVKATQNLTTYGLLSYLGNRMVEASTSSQIKIDSPAQASWKSRL